MPTDESSPHANRRPSRLMPIVVIVVCLLLAGAGCVATRSATSAEWQTVLAEDFSHGDQKWNVLGGVWRAVEGKLLGRDDDRRHVRHLRFP